MYILYVKIMCNNVISIDVNTNVNVNHNVSVCVSCARCHWSCSTSRTQNPLTESRVTMTIGLQRPRPFPSKVPPLLFSSPLFSSLLVSSLLFSLSSLLLIFSSLLYSSFYHLFILFFFPYFCCKTSTSNFILSILQSPLSLHFHSVHVWLPFLPFSFLPFSSLPSTILITLYIILSFPSLPLANLNTSYFTHYDLCEYSSVRCSGHG